MAYQQMSSHYFDPPGERRQQSHPVRRVSPAYNGSMSARLPHGVPQIPPFQQKSTGQHITDLLLSENSHLRDRVTELERRALLHDNDVALLRTSLVEMTGRLARIESMFEDDPQLDLVKTASKPPPSMARSMSVPKATDRMTQSMHASGKDGRVKRSSTMSRRSGGGDKAMINVVVGRSATGSPMRKWVSDYDMQRSAVQRKDSRPSTVAPRPPRPERMPDVETIDADEIQPRTDVVYDVNRNVVIIGGEGGEEIAMRDGFSETELHCEQPPPNHIPQLEWVYGYRGRDVTNNIHHLPSGEIAYFAGSLVVLLNVDEKTQRHYTQHTCDVASLALHPSATLCASGQTALGDHSCILIWDPSTLESIVAIPCSGDVACLAFSRSDPALLAAGNGGRLVVYKWEEGTMQCEIEMSSAPSSLHWHPSRPILVSLSEKEIIAWRLEGDTLTTINTIPQVPQRQIQCLCFTLDCTVLCGDSTGSLSLWEGEGLKVLRQTNAVHQGGVTAVAIVASTGNMLSAGADKQMMEWDRADLVRRAGPTTLPEECGLPRCISSVSSSTGGGVSLVVGTAANQLCRGSMRAGISCVVEGDPMSTSCVSSAGSLLATGSHCGWVRICDLVTKVAVWRRKFASPVSALSFSQSAHFLAVALSSGVWVVLAINSFTIIHEGKEASPILALRFAPGKPQLAIVTERSFLTYRLEGSQRFGRQLSIPCPGGCRVDWTVDADIVRVEGGGKLRFLDAGSGDPIDTLSPRASNAHWHTTTCTSAAECALLSPSTVTGCGGAVAVADGDGIAVHRRPVTALKSGYHQLRCPAVHEVACTMNRLLAVCGGGVGSNAGGQSIRQWSM